MVASGLVDVTFWQNSPSIHQAPLIREFASQWPGFVQIVIEYDLSRDRRALGWDVPNYGDAKVVIAPSDENRRAIESNASSARSLNIFSGVAAYPKTFQSFKALAQSSATIYAMLESGDPRFGLKTPFRRLRHWWEGKRYGRRVEGLLCMGQQGIDWYAERGYPKNKLLHFAYFVAPPSVTNVASADKTICFVGNICRRKNLKLLIRAFAMLPSDYRLEIVGDGEQLSECQDIASSLGLDGQLKWRGSLENKEVSRVIASSSALILPSFFDGWGAVVNEALTVGTSVICSRACGAEVLVRGNRGALFESDDVKGLAEAIEVVVSGTCAARRKEIAQWAKDRIHPAVGARYLVNILTAASQGTALPPPWI